MDLVEVLVRRAYGGKRVPPVSMTDVLGVPALADALAPHLRGLTHEERHEETRHLISSFRNEALDGEEQRGTITAAYGDLDDRQMAIVVANLVLMEPPRNAGHEDSPYATMTERRAAAIELPGFADGKSHNHVRRVPRNPRQFGNAFCQEFVAWLGLQPEPPVVSLADFVAPSRIKLEDLPDAFDELEVFVNGDETAARLVAAGLQLPDSPRLDVAHAELVALAKEWEVATTLSTEERRTQAAMTWLTRMLGEHEREIVVAFSGLPEGLSLSIRLFEEETGGEDLVETAARLLSVGLLEESRPRRYRMPVQLHQRLSPVIGGEVGADGLATVHELLVSYYEPLLWEVVAALELDRFTDSKTYRLRAGYDADARVGLPAEAARLWLDDEVEAILAVLEWDDKPVSIPKLRIAYPMLRINDALKIDDPAELAAKIESDMREQQYRAIINKRDVEAYNRDRAENLAALAALNIGAKKMESG